MKVKFLDPQGNLPASLIKLGYSSNANFHLENEEEYLVYGISIWRNVIHYLVIPSGLKLPNWLPADLFQVTDPSLPSEWYFRYLGKNHSSEVTMKIGYKEIALDDDHDTDLIERMEGAIKVFLLRQQEAESSKND